MIRVVKFAVLLVGMTLYTKAIGQWNSEESYRINYLEGLAGDSEYCGIYEYKAPDKKTYSLGVVQTESEFLCYNLARRNYIWIAGRLKATLKRSSSDVFEVRWTMGDGKSEKICWASWEHRKLEITGLSAGKTVLTKTWPPENIYSLSTPPDAQPISRMEELTKSELRLARNSIYARHGRIFSSPDLRDYFDAKEWYDADSTFVDSMLTREEKDTVSVIQMWERSTSVLWKKQVDLDGDGVLEHCTALALDSQYCVVVNNQVHVFADLWAKEKEWAMESDHAEGLWREDWHDDWYEDEDVCPNFLVLNLDDSTPAKQLWVSQKEPEAEESGILHHWLFYHEHKVSVFSVFSDIDGPHRSPGIFRDTLGTWTVERRSCPGSFYRYSVGNTGLVIEEAINYSPPEGGCPACVDGEALVDMADGSKKLLKDIQSGDAVRAVDPSTGEFESAKVESLIKVSHKTAVQYQFEHASIIATEDHPFLSTREAWVSLHPTKTKNNYVGYEGIEQLQVGDKIVNANGDEMTLLSVTTLPFTEPVYSIEALSWGRGFVANGVVVGVAKPKEVVAWLPRDED